jgi:death on curing protein
VSRKKPFVWLNPQVIDAVHDIQLAVHGGAIGIRDAGLLESALIRPVNLFAYTEPKPDLADCAAAYGYGIARNHPFIDGNKRTAYVALELFLDQNGYELNSSDEQSIMIMLSVAASDMSEAALADWIRAHLTKL